MYNVRYREFIYFLLLDVLLLSRAVEKSRTLNNNSNNNNTIFPMLFSTINFSVFTSFCGPQIVRRNRV